MEVKDRMQIAQWILERQLGWISAAEIKTGVVVTIDIAMIAGLAAAFGQASTKTFWIYTFSLMSLILSIIGLAAAAYSILPRLDGPRDSMLYFGRIYATPRPEYILKVESTTDADLLKDLSEQIHRNAEIACNKHRWVGYSMRWSFASAVTWIVSIILLLI